MTASPILFGLDILGSPAVVSVPDEAARAAAEAILEGFSRPDVPDTPARYALTHGPDAGWKAWAGDRQVHDTPTLDEAVQLLEWQIVNDALVSHPGLLHVHGAGLSLPSGTGSLLILGASGSGKTTLALALMGRGYLPYADDVTLVDPECAAPIPFPRAFHVDGSVRDLVTRLRHPPRWRLNASFEDYCLPERWAADAVPVLAVFFPILGAATAPTLRRLSMSEGAAALLSHSTTLARDARLALRAAAKLTARAACYAVECGGVDETADLVAATAEALADAR